MAYRWVSENGDSPVLCISEKLWKRATSMFSAVASVCQTPEYIMTMNEINKAICRGRRQPVAKLYSRRLKDSLYMSTEANDANEDVRG